MLHHCRLADAKLIDKVRVISRLPHLPLAQCHPVASRALCRRSVGRQCVKVRPMVYIVGLTGRVGLKHEASGTKQVWNTDTTSNWLHENQSIWYLASLRATKMHHRFARCFPGVNARLGLH